MESWSATDRLFLWAVQGEKLTLSERSESKGALVGQQK